MRTAFGTLLFVLVYGPIAYMVYAEVKGQRSGVRPRLRRSASYRRADRLPAAGQSRA
jgi:hypothetical protein